MAGRYGQGETLCGVSTPVAVASSSSCSLNIPQLPREWAPSCCGSFEMAGKQVMLSAPDLRLSDTFDVKSLLALEVLIWKYLQSAFKIKKNFS